MSRPVRTLAAIDIGTVSTRLIVARVDEAGRVSPLDRQAIITNLGLGVDARGLLDQQAVDLTCQVVAGYCVRIPRDAERVAVTLTSAARDASNADAVLCPLREMGLDPQVIPGQVEARLSLLGVTSDFVGTPVLVADIGGGSTELVEGMRRRDAHLQVGRAVSLDVGCRRVTERFFGEADVPAPDDVRAARAFVLETLAPFFCAGEGGGQTGSPRTLACVGGTATSLVAVANGLVPYDSSFVHLHRTTRDCVRGLAERLLAMDGAARRSLPGLQPKRADVIGAGALILDVLMEAGGFDEYVASESDSLFGLLACMRAQADGVPSPFGWEVRTSPASAVVCPVQC